MERRNLRGVRPRPRRSFLDRVAEFHRQCRHLEVDIHKDIGILETDLAEPGTDGIEKDADAKVAAGGGVPTYMQSCLFPVQFLLCGCTALDQG